MLESMKKKLIFITLGTISIFLSIIVFQKQLICFTAESILSRSSFFGKDLRIDYDHLKIQKGGFVFHNVQLSSQAEIDIESLKLNFHLSFSPFHLKKDLQISKPTIRMKELPSKLMLPQFGNEHLEFSIDQGQLIFDEVMYYFSCNIPGNITFSTEEEKTNLSINLERSSDVNYASFHFDHFPIATFFKFFKESEVQCDQGLLNGKAHIEFSNEEGVQEATYHLKGSNLQLSHPKMGITLRGDFDWDSLSEIVNPGDLFGDIKLISATVSFQKWGEGVVSGHLGLNRPIELKGKLGEKDLHLLGIGALDSLNGWKLALEISLSQFQKPRMRTFLSWKSTPNGDLFFQSDFEHLQQTEIKLFQSLFASYFPITELFALETETLKAKIKGKMVDHDWVNFQISDLHAKELIFSSKKHPFESSIQSLKMSVDVDLTSINPYKNAKWDVQIEKGKLSVPSLSIKACDLNGHLQGSLYNLNDSFLQGDIDGVLGKISIEGPINDAEILLKLKGSEATLDLVAYLKQLDSRWSFDGDIFIKGKEIETNQINYGLLFESENLGWSNFTEQLINGWFSARGFSSELLQVPLAYFGHNFEVTGSVDFEGRITRKQLNLEIFSNNLSYYDPFVTISCALPNSRAGGKLLYDFNTKKWGVSIPLLDATCFEKTFKLFFEHIDGLLIIDGNQIRASNLTAVSEEIDVNGELALTFLDDGVVEFEITTQNLRGNVENVITFLHHFDYFRFINLPIRGKVSSKDKGVYFHTYFGDETRGGDWEIALSLAEGAHQLSPSVFFEDLSCDITWASQEDLLVFSKAKGDLILFGSKTSKDYKLNSHYLKIKGGKSWDFDMRIESATHDILRLIGQGEKQGGNLDVQLDPELSHFFGAKLDLKTCLISSDFELQALDFATEVSTHHVLKHAEFLSYSELIDLTPSMIDEFADYHLEGNAFLKMAYSKQNSTFSINLKSDDLVINHESYSPFQVVGEKEGDHFSLIDFSAGKYAANGEFHKVESNWLIPNLEIFWNAASLTVHDGVYQPVDKSISFQYESKGIQLIEFLEFIPENFHPYSKGELSLEGKANVHLKNGFLESTFQLSCEDYSDAQLTVLNKNPLKLTVTQRENMLLEGIDLHFQYGEAKNLWSHLEAASFSYNVKDAKWSGSEVKCVVSPEMTLYLAQSGLLPHLGAQNHKLVFSETPFSWENQIAAIFDFEYTAGGFDIKGHLRDGYYWIGEESYGLQKCQFNLTHEKFKASCDCQILNHPFNIEFQTYFSPNNAPICTIKNKEQESLFIHFQKSDTELSLQNIEGSLCGLTFSFHRHPNGEHTILKGQLKIDAPKTQTLLPKELSDAINLLELGTGYVISGDLIIDKDNMAQSHFDGYLKGKDFEFLGSHLKTLLSEIHIQSDKITLENLTISDDAGIINIQEMGFHHLGKIKWLMTIPEVTMQDFRPSLLRKIGGQQGRLKPLVIRDLKFSQIQGILGEPETFSGRGQLHFINTFKSKSHILDLPIEIISRLGLDMGLLVPVMGDLSYEIREGKIYITDLSESFSEGKRSQFYLSKSNRSFIEFDGSINVNIKMKQYVLLKFTEPFTLSIKGTLNKPRYSLNP